MPFQKTDSRISLCSRNSTRSNSSDLAPPVASMAPASVAHAERQRPLPTGDAVPRRDRARGLWAARFRCPAGGSGDETGGQPHPFPRCRFASNSTYRERLTLGKLGRGGRQARIANLEEPTPAERRVAMTWAQQLQRVFDIYIQICAACRGAVRIIARLERIRASLRRP